MKEQLIQEVWSMCSLTHNDQDYVDLCEMSIREISEILTDIKLSNL